PSWLPSPLRGRAQIGPDAGAAGAAGAARRSGWGRAAGGACAVCGVGEGGAACRRPNSDSGTVGGEFRSPLQRLTTGVPKPVPVVVVVPFLRTNGGDDGLWSWFQRRLAIRGSE